MLQNVNKLINMLNTIQKYLFDIKDDKFAKFNSALIPNIRPNTVIGVKTPLLRKYAKRINYTDNFLNTLPHKYFEENQIHAFVLSNINDFETCVNMINIFLPYIDNWATCDQLIPKVFAKNTDKLLPQIKLWIKSKHVYTVRFAIGLLMRFYLGNRFNSKYADMVIKTQSTEYYINMMRAWYFATALAKNWDSVIDIIKQKKLDDWTHNKTIQKAIESFRITSEQKQILRGLKN